MKIKGFLTVGAAIAPLLFAAPAMAQDASMQVGNATVTIGGGTAILTLPDVEFTRNYNLAVPPRRTVLFKDSEDFGDEVGWNINGSIAVPLSGSKTVSLNGFWANIEDDDPFVCRSTALINNCIWVNIVDSPGGSNVIIANTGQTAIVNTERDVDHWGASLEAKWQLTPSVMGVTKAPNPRYLAAAVDIRGIDQDLSLSTTNVAFPGSVITYNEDLDTRYYGAYLAWGGDYSPFLLRGLWESWGLQSSFMLRGGVYYADTDYEGSYFENVGAVDTGQLSLSSDDVAFIGGLVLETRKRIGPRAMLSLKSEYEYYSWVPDMRYNDVDRAGVAPTGPNVGTSIDDDDAFSMRTSLRLTIGLGPRDLYQDPPLK